MWWNKQKEVETETHLYKRMKDLYKKVRVVNKIGKLHPLPRGRAYEYEAEYTGFDSNLGKRVIYMFEFSCSGTYVFTYFNIDYNEFLADILYTKECVFSLCVGPDDVQITQPRYKVNAEQITPEQINNAIKEFEAAVNAEYEKYLVNKQYHKMQEEKLANLL